MILIFERFRMRAARVKQIKICNVQRSRSPLGNWVRLCHFRAVSVQIDTRASISVRLLHGVGSQQRYDFLKDSHTNLYPRVVLSTSQVDCGSFARQYQSLAPGEVCRETSVVVYGRASSLRSSSAKLFFVDIRQDGQRLQAVCSLSQLVPAGVELAAFKGCLKRLQIGDIIRLEGYPHRTHSGELSILLQTLPEIVTPCLPPLPFGLIDEQTRAQNRHVDFIVNPSTAGLIRTRSAIIQYIRSFLIADGQIEVQTPILAEEAGGATARPFQTAATELASRKIALRIAPELWLKRMVIGGFDKIFEIGPSFRNEGIDLTHNPEFYTCEFYRAYTDLPKLMEMTEALLMGLAGHLQKLKKTNKVTTNLSSVNFGRPFACIDFIPALESAIQCELPNLQQPDARNQLAAILRRHHLRNTESDTLPQMLDRLSAAFLESQCLHPTFLINPPECLSPLAKSFVHQTTGQRVAARAELFINSTEVVNMYEEENSPIEQRRKFVEQYLYRDSSSGGDVDEAYLEALEWGLPPTGGWGGGIERICMLLTGAKRISEVLAFGSLRNIVGHRRRSGTLHPRSATEGLGS